MTVTLGTKASCPALPWDPADIGSRFSVSARERLAEMRDRAVAHAANFSIAGRDERRCTP
ncbi:hypothetical protein [Nocardia amikacinitolerans]|uniref:hypothetical protein n=1 Tax=Nocardia amikacinitolerans TaxID=756689 RepID=UPI0012EDF147|nr:hypothetical protein [Nocardia amikacinitolerans]